MPAIDEAKYVPTTWGGDKYQDVEVPSGQVCLIQRLDMQALMEAGVLTRIDALTVLVDNKHVSRKAKGGKNSKKSQEMQNDLTMKQIMNDPEKFKEVLEVVDRVIMAVVIAPKLHEVPEDNDDRKPDLVYIDTVDLTDKMFLLQYVMGGTSGIARFRGELQQYADDLADVDTVESPAQ
jgi:hypothetical protein